MSLCQTACGQEKSLPGNRLLCGDKPNGVNRVNKANESDGANRSSNGTDRGTRMPPCALFTGCLSGYLLFSWLKQLIVRLTHSVPGLANRV